MTLPTLIEEKDRNWIFKVLSQTHEAELNAVIIGFWLGSAMTSLEICRIQIQDVIKKNGDLAKCFPIKGEVARDFYLSNIKLQNILKTYLSIRSKDGDHPDYYQGFNPTEPLFKRRNGNTFKITRRVTDKGNVVYKCASLNEHIKRLLAESGIEKPSIGSGRRTAAVRLKRCGVNVPTIHKMLGNKTLEATLRLVETDKVDMTKLAELAFDNNSYPL